MPEVWFWVDGNLYLFGLEAGEYEPRQSSRFLPELEIAQLASFVAAADKSNQAEAVWAFRKALEVRSGDEG